MQAKNNMEEKSIVGEWYKGQRIFITGGTGFMGKVLIEKLLYACSDVSALYILMRPKRGKSIQDRLKDIWALPAFERLRCQKPHLFNKIIPIEGEITMDGLGITPADKKMLIENTTIVFHCAATLRLEAQLKDSLEMNMIGTQRVLALATGMKKLKVFIHLSTAFCSADIDIFEEKVYDPPVDPLDVINTVKWMPPRALVKATPDIIRPHPNTYTFTKRLAETLVAKEAKNMRVAIVRPSIVTPSISEPVTGWVDSLNGPMGVLVAAGKGVLRIMHCNGDNSAHLIPADMAINAILVVAWKLGTAEKQPEEVPVYNLTNGEVLKVTWSDILDMGRKVGYEYPFEMQVWYPNGSITSNYWVYFIWSIFLHWLPAVFIDLLMFIFRQPRFMIRVQKKIYNGLELLQFFTTREWVFKSQNFLRLVNDLNPKDKEIFTMDFFQRTVEEYLRYCIIGARQYCMKENLKSLWRCGIQQKVLYVVDTLFKLFLVYGFFCLAWSYSDTVKYMTNFIKDFINGFISLEKINWNKA
ncbi:epimerase [Oryctes borbonicus]|uniref:Fatty acyl-CoA reductase n=1 Tax=Oryctes borbonicus TaxID=1629725 RepID=A0A0T6BD07_9SCAR|nr:epimerase [Oryctes borbonicus]